MDKITGIIAEFNPFHNGHQLLLDQAEGTKVIVMSGNWMQRGEPAFVDKWTRTEMALRAGADLVVELPVMSALQGADFFAEGAVRILNQLAVDEILFGSESELDYQRISEIYAENADEMKAYMAELPELMAYPLKAEKAWAHFAGVRFDGGTPNHILGLAYAKAVMGTNIQLRTIKRETGYNDTKLAGQVASATAIRENFSQARDFIPSESWALLEVAAQTGWPDFWEFLRYKITASTTLTHIYQVNEELSQRIKTYIKSSSNLSELIEQVYTKRYTKGHIRRLLTYILLDIPRDFKMPESIHVLGFSEKGQKVLAQARKREIPVATKIGKHPWDAVTQRADEIYRLGNPEIKEQSYRRRPIIWS
ncbi:MAG: nucleotidyltransferase [Streptococcaceae bacterium]|jgi:predicted nucleotidyltransferase|nr:nucleotidyltransferase [Streptococcaceae bacterium]